MPSSYVDSIPPIMKKIIELNPQGVVDVGPGWGKYGLMCREYLGDVRLTAVEVTEGRLPTQDIIYDHVYEADVRHIDPKLWELNDLVLIIDVIEHMPKEDGQKLYADIINSGCSVLISTPKVFSEQHDDHNPYEEHICVWDWEDFWTPWLRREALKTDLSTIDSVIMLLTPGEEVSDDPVSDD